MQFQTVYQDGESFLPAFELNMTYDQVFGIITDLKRKQILINQLLDRSLYYIFRAQQNEYLHLTVEELITFLINVTEHHELTTHLLDYFELKEERKVKIKNLTPSKRMYVTLLRAYFAHQPTLVLEEPFFFLEEHERRQFKRIIDDLSKEKQILVITSNFEDALISCNVIYRLNKLGFQQMDIQDSEEDKPEAKDPDLVNITLQKIYTKRNNKVILFNPPEIDFIESIEGSVLVHVDGENYDCTLTLTELEQRLANFGFFRCHRSYIVNLQKIREIITWSKNSYSLRLHTGKDTVVPLSRTKLQDLKSLLNL
ncbi:LytTR family transcriptional regulator DNA-binding domain-containing protein [Paenibacillus sp. 2TAF8]|uniref:LytTR family transcriptional regulator DNA-binding domain-containing protein n=1 Tax=Paenibacillus sp. 2TAF8 TaxID=3233020 RepID=UPI003F9863E1